MSVQPVYNPPSSPVLSSASTSSDPQVQKIMSQIKDWEGCPTTDRHTKQVKVAALEQQLASVESSLKHSMKAASTSPTGSATPAGSATPGLGQRVDVYA